VNGGVLLVHGVQPGSAVVVNGGTLGGHGEVGSTLVNPGAHLVAEDNEAGAPALLTVAGDLTLTPNAVVDVHLNSAVMGTGYGVLRVTGAVNLNNATFNPIFSFTPSTKASFLVLDHTGAGPILGTFNGILEGGVVPGTHVGTCFSLTYKGGDGNDVAIVGADLNDLFVQALYKALNLAPDAQMQQFEQQLNGLSGGALQAAKVAVAHQVWELPKHRQAIVNEFFQEFQFKGSNPKLFTKLVKHLLNGGFAEGAVLEEFLNSPAFLKQHRKPRDYVRTLYESIFRTPPPGKTLTKRLLRKYLAILQGPNGRNNLIALLLSNDEIYNGALDNSQQLLFDATDALRPGERANLLAQMKDGTLDNEGLFVALTTTTSPPFGDRFLKHFMAGCNLS
jgi:hypothetical protein